MSEYLSLEGNITSTTVERVLVGSTKTISKNRITARDRLMEAKKIPDYCHCEMEWEAIWAASKDVNYATGQASD